MRRQKRNVPIGVLGYMWVVGMILDLDHEDPDQSIPTISDDPKDRNGIEMILGRWPVAALYIDRITETTGYSISPGYG